jgi:hypothetical protein
MARKKKKFDQKAMDRVTDRVLAFRPKQAEPEAKRQRKEDRRGDK